ncbi:MAG: hypothetical protein BWX99_02271 [Deltaproteobacteria bacterium ADurb.Bin151]|nr:MAG: hypothetical protein BWX99_02271 [Deltaproteobacteria bacterium ADurb.Bin151]
MRGNIGCHANGNSRRAVEQQKRNAGSQQRRFLERFVIVGYIIDGVFFQIGQHFIGYASQPALRVTHGRRRITVYGTKVSLSIHQHIAQRKILRHPHHGVIDGCVTVRVILTHDIADDTCGFFVWLIVAVAHFVHRIQYSPMHRFQAVAYIGYCPADDDAHGIIHVGFFHFVFYIHQRHLMVDITFHVFSSLQKKAAVRTG